METTSMCDTFMNGWTDEQSKASGNQCLCATWVYYDFSVCVFAPVVAECFLCANGLAREDSFFFFSSISIQKIQTLSSIDCCAWKKKESMKSEHRRLIEQRESKLSNGNKKWSTILIDGKTTISYLIIFLSLSIPHTDTLVGNRWFDRLTLLHFFSFCYM